MGDWCILRTKGSSTLRLARSLAEFDAWTPTEIRVERNRKTNARAEQMIAVMPTYVFAPACHLLALLDEADCPMSQHPDFSVFRYFDRIPVIDERELVSLRSIERRTADKGAPVRLPIGQDVRTPDGPYQGLTGQIIEHKGKFTLVAFPGLNFDVKFAPWKLEKAA